MIVSGRGGQVDVSMRDVMLSQLNYRAAAYLNDGAVPRRYAGGAHSTYVPAQLFPTASGYLALFITHDRFWQLFAAEAGLAAGEINSFATMAGRTAHRDEVLTLVTKALAADTADHWETRLRGLGVPARSVRTLPQALSEAGPLIAAAGGYRLVGNPIRIDGYDPDYTAPPRLGQHGG
jgi:crotonobetainyl-CoA:carnitine CoA-transferase CaiB-like acyl-CoA transferase